MRFRTPALVLAWAGLLFSQIIVNPGAPTNNPFQTNVSTNWLYLNKVHYAGAWTAGATYNAQDLVLYSGTAYISLQALNTGNTPPTSPLWWVQFAGSGSGDSSNPQAPSSPCNVTALWASNVKQITPQMCGAKGDGVTDDSAAISMAKAAALTNHTCVYFPGAVYAYSTTFTLGTAGECWHGDGDSVSQLLYTGTGGGLIVGGTPATPIAGVTIEGITVQGTSSAAVGVLLQNITGWNFRQVSVSSFGGNQVEARNALDGEWRGGAYTNSATASGLYIGSNTAGASFKNRFVNIRLFHNATLGFLVDANSGENTIDADSEGNDRCGEVLYGFDTRLSIHCEGNGNVANTATYSVVLGGTGSNLSLNTVFDGCYFSSTATSIQEDVSLVQSLGTRVLGGTKIGSYPFLGTQAANQSGIVQGLYFYSSSAAVISDSTYSNLFDIVGVSVTGVIQPDTLNSPLYVRSGTTTASSIVLEPTTPAYAAYTTTIKNLVAYWDGTQLLSGTTPFIQVSAVATPASSTATCTAGQFAFDANYAYYCVAANTWNRVATTHGGW